MVFYITINKNDNMRNMGNIVTGYADESKNCEGVLTPRHVRDVAHVRLGRESNINLIPFDASLEKFDAILSQFDASSEKYDTTSSNFDSSSGKFDATLTNREALSYIDLPQR